jgi:hypothetical protein
MAKARPEATGLHAPGVSSHPGNCPPFTRWTLLGLIVLGVLVVHGWWLPRKGVNGWTAEPRDRYYALLGLDLTGKPVDRAG